MKQLFTLCCWAVIALGLFLSCAKKPRPALPPLMPVIPGELIAEDPPKISDEILLNLADVEKTVYFAFDSHELERVSALAAVVEYVQYTPGDVVLVGYASEEGTEEYNMALGERRATAVRDFLAEMGVKRTRMQRESRGKSRPVTSDPAEFWKNRRVEVHVLKGEG